MTVSGRGQPSKEKTMSQSLPVQSVADATDSFVAEVLARAPVRLEAKVSSADGVPLLCVVEAVLGRSLSRATAQELVWLNGAPAPGVHRLQLQAFGPANALLAEVCHEFAA
jgi:hypothetical protein